jgi:hypothetical protein
MNTMPVDMLDELLADRALGECDAPDANRFPPDAVSSLDVAAGGLSIAMLDSTDTSELPAGLKDRLLASGREWCDAVATSAPAPLPNTGTRPRSSLLPWLAAAAAILLAVVAWWPAPRVDARADRQRLLARAGDAVTLAWKDWDSPEVAGVTGDVVWSDKAQKGYMRFANLPTKADAEYQLWIIDSRGMEQRISGGIFNGGPAEIVVPVTPGIEVRGAAAFAVTIEKPGGTWVSDMSRRVVIAAK